MSIATRDKTYYDAAIPNVAPKLKLETFANSEYDKNKSMGQTRVFTVVTSPESDGSPKSVDPRVGPTGIVDSLETTVEFELGLYHDDVMSATIEGDLYGAVQGELFNRIADVSRLAADERNELAKAAYINEIPDNDAESYVWGTQNSKTYVKVSTGTETRGGHSLVYNGTDTTSEAALVSVAAGETFSDPKWFAKFYARLTDNGATPIVNINGEDFFVAALPSNVWAKLTESSAFRDDVRHLPWGNGTAALTNGITVYKGFIINIIPAEQMKKPGLGAAGIDIYSCLFHGRDYLGVAADEAGTLPAHTVGGNAPMRIRADKYTEIRVTPQGDKFGGNVDVAAMSRIKYKILKPEEGIKFNVAGV